MNYSIQQSWTAEIITNCDGHSVYGVGLNSKILVFNVFIKFKYIYKYIKFKVFNVFIMYPSNLNYHYIGQKLEERDQKISFNFGPLYVRRIAE